MDIQKELTVALQAAQEAGKIIARYANIKVDVAHKSPEQPVTIADREANDIIKKIILNTFPDDGWLSEETIDTSARLEQQRVWIVDPLDGTKEFIAHVPEYAVSIALIIDHNPVVGVIFNPAKKELYYTSLEGGAFLNEKPLKVSTQSDLKKGLLLASNSEIKKGDWQQFADSFGQIIPAGGLAYKMGEVARGNADASFSLSPKNEWDMAAGILLVQEAGGIVTDPQGAPFKFNQPSPRKEGIIYANPYLHAQLIELIN